MTKLNPIEFQMQSQIIVMALETGKWKEKNFRKKRQKRYKKVNNNKKHVESMTVFFYRF